jgi:hypothetical protein
MIATQEVEIRRQRSGGLRFKVSLGKKFTRSHFNQWLGVVVGTCHPSYTRKHR